MKKNQTPMMTRNGSHELRRIDQNGLDSGARAVMSTPWLSSAIDDVGAGRDHGLEPGAVAESAGDDIVGDGDLR